MCLRGLPKMTKPPFNAMLVRKRRGQLEFVFFQNYETRNESTQALIEEANETLGLSDFSWRLINTDDRYEGDSYRGLPVLSYAVPPGRYELACPDFVFDHWRQTQLDDYETKRRQLMAEAGSSPTNDVLGWRGAETHPIRRAFVEQFAGCPGFDVALINWARNNPDRLTAAQFLSIDEQQQTWRYLIDLEGRGYSARLKLLLATGRVVFIQERNSHEFYYQHLVPWVHFVPVKSDLSDLQPHLERLIADPELERAISRQAIQFADQHLSRAVAVQRFKDCLRDCSVVKATNEPQPACAFLDQITPVILTFNEASNLARTLHPLRHFKQVVVVDSGSTDETLAICARYPQVRVVTRPFDAHATQWNFAVHDTGITTPWVLALDADYVLSDDVITELSSLKPEPVTNGYQAAFVYCVQGHPLRATLYPPVTVLYRRDRGHYRQDGHTQRLEIPGEVLPLQARISHDDRKPLARWLSAQEKYAQLECALLRATPWRELSVQDRLRRMMLITPWLVPLYCLTVGRGLLDGWAGVYYALHRGAAESILSLKLMESRVMKTRKLDSGS